jgi:hypothetical protein
MAGNGNKYYWDHEMKLLSSGGMSERGVKV